MRSRTIPWRVLKISLRCSGRCDVVNICVKYEKSEGGGDVVGGGAWVVAWAPELAREASLPTEYASSWSVVAGEDGPVADFPALSIVLGRSRGVLDLGEALEVGVDGAVLVVGVFAQRTFAGLVLEVDRFVAAWTGGEVGGVCFLQDVDRF